MLNKKEKRIEVRNINPQLVTPFLAEEGSVIKKQPLEFLG